MSTRHGSGSQPGGRPASAALRAEVHGEAADAGFCAAIAERARALGVLGWVREDDGVVRVHAEGASAPVGELRDFLAHGPPGAVVDRVVEQSARVEGHEQFAVRGVAAGRFDVRAHAGGYELRLEVGDAMRSWRLRKAPSMDPAVRRMAIEAAPGGAQSDATLWDGGPYEQGGRVPWPAALDRGHAVFVLHGDELRGGFALQRTRGTGAGSQWLLVKRRDEHARTA
jgi:acylphosphatase